MVAGTCQEGFTDVIAETAGRDSSGRSRLLFSGEAWRAKGLHNLLMGDNVGPLEQVDTSRYRDKNLQQHSESARPCLAHHC